MARTNRRSETSVRDRLYAEPYKFEFHQAIKLLEMCHPTSVAYGETVEPSEEPVIVKSRVYFENLSSDIYTLDPTGKAAYTHNDNFISWPDDPPQMQVNFMGIAGLPGPLPYAYSEMILQRCRLGDTSLRDFLDIFNHRLISILHRLKKQYVVGLSALEPDKSPHAGALKSLIGIRGKRLDDRLSVPDRSFLEYTGLFWQKPHSAQGLRQILSSYFEVPVTIEQCVGEWRHIHPKDECRIGNQKGQWNRLGQGALLGKRIWQQQSKIRIHMGPLDYAQFDDFLPGRSGYQALTDVVRMYMPPEIDYDINLMIKEDQIPLLKLNKKSGLGWDTWLHREAKKGTRLDASQVDSQVILNPKSVAHAGKKWLTP